MLISILEQRVSNQFDRAKNNDLELDNSVLNELGHNLRAHITANSSYQEHDASRSMTIDEIQRIDHGVIEMKAKRKKPKRDSIAGLFYWHKALSVSILITLSSVKFLKQLPYH